MTRGGGDFKGIWTRGKVLNANEPAGANTTSHRWDGTNCCTVARLVSTAGRSAQHRTHTLIHLRTYTRTFWAFLRVFPNTCRIHHSSTKHTSAIHNRLCLILSPQTRNTNMTVEPTGYKTHILTHLEGYISHLDHRSCGVNLYV